VVTAIVLVKADIQRIPEVAQTIAQIPEVSEAYSVTGEFDLVAIVRVRAHEELADVIPGRLNKVQGVTATERTSRSAPTRGTTWRRPSPWAWARASESEVRTRQWLVESSPGGRPCSCGPAGTACAGSPWPLP
jgi:Lrp/AsnC ligand binding domain